MIRLLTFTNLYPSEANPRHGIFVEARLRKLVQTGRVQACVVVPVARPPSGLALASRHAERHGIPIRYCSFPALRGVTTIFHPRLMARCARESVRELLAAQGEFDIIDAHFLYPDAVAAMYLGQWLQRPFVMTARGSDVNVALGERVAGAAIRRAARRSGAIIAVSSALRASMIQQGLPAERITVIRNGVDLDVFRPADRAALRAQLGMRSPTLLAVGNLVPEKGFDLLLAALPHLPEAQAILVGSGPQQTLLQELSRELGVAARVSWLPPMPQAALQRYYVGADLTVLTSIREGMPNVLLESLACGTPVVATAVGGAPEIVTDPVAGRLVYARSAESFAAECRAVLAGGSNAGAVRGFAERFGWEQPVADNVALLERVAGCG